MNIIICCKAVSSKLIGASSNDSDKYILNPYDAYALNDILKLKKGNNISITCLCMGAFSSIEVLRRCLAMGADNAILLSDPQFVGADTYATTYVLSKAIEMINYDLIVCGREAIDGETGQIGYGIGARSNLDCISNVNHLHLLQNKNIIAQCKEEDIMYKVQSQLPLLITYNDFSLYTETSLMALKRARKKEIAILNMKNLNISMEDCGQKGSKTKVINTIPVVGKTLKNRKEVRGTPEYKAEFLIEQLLKRGRHVDEEI